MRWKRDRNKNCVNGETYASVTKHITFVSHSLLCYSLKRVLHGTFFSTHVKCFAPSYYVLTVLLQNLTLTTFWSRPLCIHKGSQNINTVTYYSKLTINNCTDIFPLNTHIISKFVRFNSKKWCTNFIKYLVYVDTKYIFAEFCLRT